VLGASNGQQQEESNTALGLVRCTIDPANTEEVLARRADAVARGRRV
jgi:hypothetical protein